MKVKTKLPYSFFLYFTKIGKEPIDYLYIDKNILYYKLTEINLYIPEKDILMHNFIDYAKKNKININWLITVNMINELINIYHNDN